MSGGKHTNMINSSRESSNQRINNPKLSVSILDVQRDSYTERNTNTNAAGVNNPYLADSYNRLSKHILQQDVILSISLKLID